jgi:hypothetical protein
VTTINLFGNENLFGDEISSENAAALEEMTARNERLRHLFLFDVWQMLLTLMCADECGVLWPYFLENGDKDGSVVPDNVDSVRAEFAAVVEERRRRAVTAVSLVEADNGDENGGPAVKRRRTNR